MTDTTASTDTLPVPGDLGRAPRPFVIESRHPESETITSFRLRPTDGNPPWPHVAGQHLTLFAEVPGQGLQKRNYTISSAPDGRTYRISVKREAQGTVSRWLHDEARPGAPVSVAPPDGSFVLPADDARPVVMLSAGVGLTPMVAMLEAAAAGRRAGDLLFVHGTRDGATHAFGPHVRELAAGHAGIRTTFFYSQPRAADVAGRDFDVTGHVSLDWLAGHTPLDTAEYFVCGPLRFLRSFVPGLVQRGVPPERVRYEFFGDVEDLFGEATSQQSPPASGAVVAARRSRAIGGFERAAIGAALLDSAADAVVASDAEGAIVLWNAGAERIFGFTEDEALGQSLDIIIPEPFRARHWEGYRETVASGQSRYGAGDLLAVPGLHRDGRRISIEFTIVLLKDAAGKVTGMVASVRDVTARFEETKALRKRVAALEEQAASPG